MASEGISASRGDTNLISTLFERSDSVCTVTPFQVFIEDQQDLIQEAFDDELHRTKALSLTIGERRHIQSQLFRQLSAEQLRAYKEHAQIANDELKKEFDKDADSDETQYEWVTYFIISLRIALKRHSIGIKGDFRLSLRRLPSPF